jgi:hypothetical protein
MKYLLPILLLISIFSCDPEFEDGKLKCNPREQNPCPIGFSCFDPNSIDEWRCYGNLAFGYCGDNVLQGEWEECDNDKDGNMTYNTCDALGYHDPEKISVSCMDCVWDREQCENMSWCGDGEIEEPEECDGDNVMEMCFDFETMSQGYLVCTDECKIDRGYCYEELSGGMDILFVIDDTKEMQPFRDKLKLSMGYFVDRLKTTLLNQTSMGIMGVNNGSVHFGVITSGGGFDNPDQALINCNDTESMGKFVEGKTGDCGLSPGVNYLVDYPLMYCENDCKQSDCANLTNFGEPSDLILVHDSGGNPHCVNYTTPEIGNINELSSKISCMVDVASDGCVIQQPLKNMELALKSTDESNVRFLRDNALLVVVFVTNSDDCSVDSEIEFFTAEDPFDYTSHYQCLKSGVACDQDLSNAKNLINAGNGISTEFTNCKAADGTSGMAGVLHTVEQYISNIEDLKKGKKVLALSLGGDIVSDITLNLIFPLPTANEDPPDGGIPEENFESLKVQPQKTCENRILPNIRIRDFVNYFSSRDLMDGAHSLCSGYYPIAMDSIFNFYSYIFIGEGSGEMEENRE